MAMEARVYLSPEELPVVSSVPQAAGSFRPGQEEERKWENGNQGPNSAPPPPSLSELHGRPQGKGTEQILVTIIYSYAIIFPVIIK